MAGQEKKEPIRAGSRNNENVSSKICRSACAKKQVISQHRQQKLPQAALYASSADIPVSHLR